MAVSVALGRCILICMWVETYVGYSLELLLNWSRILMAHSIKFLSHKETFLFVDLLLFHRGVFLFLFYFGFVLFCYFILLEFLLLFFFLGGGIFYILLTIVCVSELYWLLTSPFNRVKAVLHISLLVFRSKICSEGQASPKFDAHIEHGEVKLSQFQKPAASVVSAQDVHQ